MSLINKMLQDLDARRGAGGNNAEPILNLSARPRRNPASTIVTSMTAVVAVGVLVAGGYAAYRYYQRPAPPPPATSVTFAYPTPVSRSEPAAAAPAVPVPAPKPPTGDVLMAQAQNASEPATRAAVPAALPTEVAAPAAAISVHVLPQPKAVSAPAEPVNLPARAKPPVASAMRPAQRAGAPARPSDAAAPAIATARADAAQGRVMSARQRAEGHYTRATAALEEGRIREAIAHLERALEAEPQHDAARQTLVRLLLEAKRQDDAMRVLQAGLALDPRQPAMAMLLARLQIERGATGIDVLLRSLPYAAAHPEYQGFLAGALQRVVRHREAVEHFRAALQAAPSNGVWWMGLGISLQAESRQAEAAEAYGRALATGTLSPELSNFVERRLDQARR